MAHSINQKIVGYQVKAVEQQPQPQGPQETVHEAMKRPDQLVGTTYKIKTPDSDHAMYVTINDIILDAGTDHERKRPYEIFINTKDTAYHQWVMALTRVLSAVFRKGGDVGFMAEELKAVFDPKGGFFKKGKFVPSLVAELGNILEQHFINQGILEGAHENK